MLTWWVLENFSCCDRLKTVVLPGISVEQEVRGVRITVTIFLSIAPVAIVHFEWCRWLASCFKFITWRTSCLNGVYPRMKKHRWEIYRRKWVPKNDWLVSLWILLGWSHQPQKCCSYKLIWGSARKVNDYLFTFSTVNEGVSRGRAFLERTNGDLEKILGHGLIRCHTDINDNHIMRAIGGTYLERRNTRKYPRPGYLVQVSQQRNTEMGNKFSGCNTVHSIDWRRLSDSIYCAGVTKVVRCKV